MRGGVRDWWLEVLVRIQEFDEGRAFDSNERHRGFLGYRVYECVLGMPACLPAIFA